MEDLVAHFLSGCGLGEQLEILDGPADGERLGDLHDSGVMVPTADALVCMAEHRVHVVGQKDSALLSRPFQDDGVARRRKLHVSNSDEIEVLKTE